MSRDKGLNTHRLRDNPAEAAFAKAWAEFAPKNLPYLLTHPSKDQHFPDEPTDRDRLVAATVVQWLGSPVGESFLDQLGYVKNPRRRHRSTG